MFQLSHSEVTDVEKKGFKSQLPLTQVTRMSNYTIICITSRTLKEPLRKQVHIKHFKGHKYCTVPTVPPNVLLTPEEHLWVLRSYYAGGTKPRGRL